MIRKRIEVRLPDGLLNGEGAPVGEVQVDVNFRALEVVESVFDANADWVATRILTSPKDIKFGDIAKVIAQWTAPYTDVREGRIREAVLGAPKEFMRHYVTAIQAACLYLRNHINEEKFDELLSPKDDEAKKDEPAAPTDKEQSAA